MITCIIIDDEQDAQEVLKMQLHKHCPQVQVLAICNNVVEATKAIKQHQPQLIFLDIEMPKQNGFDLLNALPNQNFKVIFTTAYNQFAIKAIKYAAFDYLLKPIDVKDLQDAIKRFETSSGNANAQNLQLVLQQINKPQLPQKIALHTTDGLQMVMPQEIVWVESLSNYSKIHLANNQKIMLAKTLKDVEEILEPYQFYRIHNSYLINLNHVTKYIKTEGNYVLMADGEQLSVARNRKDGFLEKFKML